ncbi:succinate dehydrogenase, hydrophobic membrane anchor protein [Kaustia mangrovi]|uniref:Succinate dehydrogenase hydrophobic membrane anchor subunit n=1 Tax=Kaustia mangrovi TaxID=2593653 RepID=A0A7S8HC41_9HYPH|nr:succinate dehydrogenase, hydrophobic membrane anchor protein [Kaustia mangrovi]QPC43216.1 succinate dehydrogenase, hydrophobic membrane anchor protein [Kaustia mangrovi]
MSLRTPLSRVRGLGAARSGTGHFMGQRLTAMANIPLAIFFVIAMVSQIGASHAEVVAFIANPVVAIVFILLIASVTYHMRLGMQVVIEDYVHGELAKILAIVANTFFTIVIALASIFAILKIAFTSGAGM